MDTQRQAILILLIIIRLIMLQNYQNMMFALMYGDRRERLLNPFINGKQVIHYHGIRNIMLQNMIDK